MTDQIDNKEEIKTPTTNCQFYRWFEKRCVNKYPSFYGKFFRVYDNLPENIDGRKPPFEWRRNVVREHLFLCFKIELLTNDGEFLLEVYDDITKKQGKYHHKAKTTDSGALFIHLFGVILHTMGQKIDLDALNKAAKKGI